jgi:O-antigen ligase
MELMLALLLVGLFTLFFAVFWSRWQWGLAALILALPFERIGSWDVVVGDASVTIRPSQLLALALIAIALVRGPRRRLQGVEWLPGLYLLAGVLSLLGASSIQRGVMVLVFTAFVWGVFWIVRTLGKEADLCLLERAVLAVTLAVSAFGLYQFIGDTFGLSIQWTGLKEWYSKTVFGFPRIQAFSLEPLYLTSLLLIPLGVFSSRFWRSGEGLSLGVLFPLSLLITLTLSRGGYLAAAVVIIITAVMHRPQWKRLGVGLWVVGLGIAGALLVIQLSSLVQVRTGSQQQGSLLNTFADQATNVENGASVSERAQARRDALEAFRESPLTGIGAGNFGTWAHARNPEISKDAIVNNEPLELLAETGVFGFAAITAFVLAILRRSWRAFRSGQGSEEERVWLIGLTAAVIGFAVQYQTFSTLYVMHIWVALGLLVAIQDRVLLAEARGNKQKPISNKRKAAL